MEAEHRASFASYLFLVVCGEQERHHRAGGTSRRFDHMGHVATVGGLIEVVEFLPRMGGVLSEVVVTSIGDALELSPSPREQELHIGGAR